MKKLLSLLFISVMAVGLSGCPKATVEPLEILTIDQLKAAKKVKIKFWHSFGKNISDQLDKIIDEFEKEYPNVTVNAESVGGGYDGLKKRMVLGIPQKELPSMVLGYPDHFAEYLQGKILEPLSEFINSENPGVGFSAEEIADFIPSYWNENNQFDDAKTVYGIPFNKSTEIMTYNADVVDPILTAKGWIVDGRWDKPTWDQVFEVGREIRKTKTAENIWPVSIDSTSNFFITMARQWGGDKSYTEATGKNAVTGLPQGKITFDNQAVRDGLKYFKDKQTEHIFNFPATWDEKYSSKSFTNQLCYIGIGSTAGIGNNIPQAGKFNIKVASYPQKSYASDANPSVIQQGTNLAMIHQTTTNLQRLACWELIKFLSSAENTEKFSKATGYMPVRTSALESPTYKDFLDGKDAFNLEPALAINAASKQTDYLFTDAAFVGSAIIRSRAGEIADAVFFGGKSIDQAIKDAYNDLNAYK